MPRPASAPSPRPAPPRAATEAEVRLGLTTATPSERQAVRAIASSLVKQAIGAVEAAY